MNDRPPAKGRRLDIKVVESNSLYAKEPKVYPREIDGRFQRLRTAAVFWLLGMFYVFPWINIGGQQLVLFDLPARRFHVFGLTFWPQDFYLLTLLLVIAALSLFFFTALAGRLWCGYACPQTVWTEVFLWIERRIEGDRNARMKLDAAPWSANKARRKITKQAVWILFSLWTGFTFVGFFTPIRELGPSLLAGTAGGWEWFWVLFYGFATYGNAGILREQVCKYMCPYARFQSAMFDRDTLVISYDVARGEPRGHRRRAKPATAAGTGESGVGTGQSGAAARSGATAMSDAVAPASIHSPSRTPDSPNLGDCIDCLACVQVCPTGIDIRDGLQIECIACAACIDACDAVMDKMNYPRGLIRYTTENMLEGKSVRVLRPRTLIYAGVLTAFILGFVWSVAARAPVIVEVLRDRNALFRTIAHGAIENSYNVKLVNKTDGPLLLSLRASTDLPLRTVGRAEVSLASGEVFSLPLTLRADAGTVNGHAPITIEVVGADGEVLATSSSLFYAPDPK
ncbi:MAG TPA: cytochrome c oxidase accessory protein CcoG [Dokdonella sp.]|uniref:RdxA/RdxB/FixG family protein n=1 Tax=Dokdonella sp. TaxID=2291710 RepID=UPI0025BBAFDF|nr:cytochrome c oxidase accessory protein CcoG [Dokdonella sp.]MBX3692687.1 cytochrome c oxidase accessory protein CcoG [Dokdonella sp.]MCW5568640.1 cytochrome c oxidase accessory protein CcoG [Dokdonella sp.]HNR92641.1 cytochrome c oxidase accessory protein CcoG [Dokdonella sp.]